MSVIFVFVDGVGLAPTSADNPLATAPTPTLQQLLGGPLTIEQAQERPRLLLRPIDATLGVDGIPQSGTGQTALFAGFNAAHAHGHHQPHFPPVALRERLANESIFRRVMAGGGQALFANAFGPGYWDALASRRLRKSASVIAAEGAGLPFRDLDDLARGEALSWDITGEHMVGRPATWALHAPQQAGQQLARLAQTHNLVMFETFLTDLAGHGRLDGVRVDSAQRLAASARQIQEAVGLIDGLLEGVIAAMRPTDTLLISSDHGNIESLTAPGHTRNPVPLLVIGAAVAAFRGVTDLTGVAEPLVRVALGQAPQEMGAA